VGPLLSRSEHGRLAEGIALAAELLTGRRASFVHGDLLPVNVIVRGGELAALLDFEFARLADPLLDAGWFHSIVAFHHPLEHRGAWDAFLAASRIDADDPVIRDLLRTLPTLRYLEILDDRGTAEEGALDWMSMLRAHLARA
jgi:aminoglycoside phosphotransferase (APT) family kinase protein